MRARADLPNSRSQLHGRLHGGAPLAPRRARYAGSLAWRLDSRQPRSRRYAHVLSLAPSSSRRRVPDALPDAGYGGTTQGVWPYTYDACDVGTLPNQTCVVVLASLLAAQTVSPKPSLTLLFRPQLAQRHRPSRSKDIGLSRLRRRTLMARRAALLGVHVRGGPGRAPWASSERRQGCARECVPPLPLHSMTYFLCADS